MTQKTLQINKEQKKAIEFGEGPLLIIAGAGTGKTTVITQRIIYLLSKKGLKPDEILGLTFTDKAAQEMEDRVSNMLPIGYYDLWISTFHAFCQRILKEHGLDIGISPDFKLLDETQAWLLVRQNLDKFSLDYYRPLGNPTKHISSLLKHFSKCKNEEIYPEDYLKYADSLRLNSDDIAVGSKSIKGKDKKELAILQQEADRVKEIANAYATYQKLLLDNDSLDFGDLLNYTLRLFQKRPKILEEYRQQFKYLLVDEFQDTNYVQYELVKLLASPRDNITVSADDDQAIYMWRGASFNNVLQFKKDFPKSQEVILTKNYRSRQGILDLAYKFIQFNNPDRLEYQLNKMKLENNALSVLKELKKISKRLIAENKGKAKIEVLHFSTGEEESRGVVKKILEIIKNDKTAKLNDFAILVRANSYAVPFCKELERNKIPYQFVSSKGLYSKPVIIDIISYLKVLNNYYENAALFRIINLPLFNIPYEDVSKIIQYSHKKGQDIYDTLQSLSLIKGISQKTIQEINFLVSSIKKHSSLAQSKKVSEVLVTALKDLGYFKYIVHHNEDEGKRNINLINQFYNKVKEFEENQNDPSLNNFIKEIDLELESGEEGTLKTNLEEGPEMINVLTIHGAKGLEFKYVFIVDLVDKRFPSIGRKEKIIIPDALVKEFVKTKDLRLAHLEEERRLFYVAMTRAKEGLIMSWADDYGGITKRKPSRFLIEADLIKTSTNPENALSLPLNDKNIIFHKKTKKKYPLPPYFSYTQLAAYQKCPLQYKLAHILKIPSPGKSSLSFGKAIHKTLEDFLKLNQSLANTNQKNLFESTKERNSKKNVILPLKDLLDIYERSWIDEWYADKLEKERYYKLGKEALKNFYNDFIKKHPKIKLLNGKPALEREFNLKISSYIIKGKIDRIDEIKGNKVEIIDYKTGNPKEILSQNDKQQLLIYQIAAEQVFGLEPVNLTYYYLNNSSRKSFLGTPQDKEKIKEKIIEIIEKIKNNEFDPTPGWQCEFCDFRDICPYRAKLNR